MQFQGVLLPDFWKFTYFERKKDRKKMSLSEVKIACTDKSVSD